MTPKEKALELVDKMFNTENCGIEHFPNKRYCDCSEINMYQAQQCALVAVDEILHNFGLTTNGQTFFTEHRAVEFYKQVQQEIENL